jgi:hypothetical protein
MIKLNGRHLFLIVALAACAGFTVGLAVGAYQIPPFKTIAATKDFVLGREPEKKPPPPPSYDFTAELDLTDEVIASIVRPTNTDQLQRLRERLIQHIWRTSNLPYDEMPRETRSVQDARWQDMENLREVDDIVVEMKYSIESHVYHFIPKQRRNKLLLFHQGHLGDFIANKETISYYVEKGFDVLAFAMPLYWRNKPADHWIHTPHFGPIFVPDAPSGNPAPHKYIPFLSSPQFNPAQLFFHPVVVALNYALAQRPYETVGMVGLSGGGWTTAILPALDTRIRFSVQIAGSLPFYLKSIRPTKDMGDYEQFGLPLYEIANYMELYLLSSFGEDRVHVQILNGNDPCCFDQPASKQYAGVLQQLIVQMEMPGAFQFYIDNTHSEHAVSQFSRDLIDALLDTKSPSGL